MLKSCSHPLAAFSHCSQLSNHSGAHPRKVKIGLCSEQVGMAGVEQRFGICSGGTGRESWRKIQDSETWTFNMLFFHLPWMYLCHFHCSNNWSRKAVTWTGPMMHGCSARSTATAVSLLPFPLKMHHARALGTGDGSSYFRSEFGLGLVLFGMTLDSVTCGSHLFGTWFSLEPNLQTVKSGCSTDQNKSKRSRRLLSGFSHLSMKWTFVLRALHPFHNTFRNTFHRLPDIHPLLGPSLERVNVNTLPRASEVLPMVSY